MGEGYGGNEGSHLIKKAIRLKCAVDTEHIDTIYTYTGYWHRAESSDVKCISKTTAVVTRRKCHT